MAIIDTPFVERIGIEQAGDGILRLSPAPALENHLQTVHAGALFTLAETASAEALRVTFPELVDKVIPVVRDARVRLRNPATGVVSAFPSISEDARERCRAQLARKGRSSIAVDVELQDAAGLVILTASFTWFVQLLD